MKTVRIRVTNEVGLHARTAAVFAAEAARFASAIGVRSLARDSGPVDGKSILTVLTLGVEQGHEIEITAEGPDEDAAAAALETLIRTDFAGRL